MFIQLLPDKIEIIPKLRCISNLHRRAFFHIKIKFDFFFDLCRAFAQHKNSGLPC